MKREVLGKPVTVDFETDDEDVSLEELEAVYETFEAEFTEEIYAECIEEVAADLVESVFQPDGEPDEDAYERVAADMELVRLTVFIDAFVLFFTADKELPGGEIIVQLNLDYEVEDIIVEE